MPARVSFSQAVMPTVLLALCVSASTKEPTVLTDRGLFFFGVGTTPLSAGFYSAILPMLGATERATELRSLRHWARGATASPSDG